MKIPDKPSVTHGPAQSKRWKNPLVVNVLNTIRQDYCDLLCLHWLKKLKKVSFLFLHVHFYYRKVHISCNSVRNARFCTICYHIKWPDNVCNFAYSSFCLLNALLNIKRWYIIRSTQKTHLRIHTRTHSFVILKPYEWKWLCWTEKIILTSLWNYCTHKRT